MLITLYDGLKYELNCNEFTAKVIGSHDANGNTNIPKFINYESNQYLITIIGQGSFKNNKKIKTISFSEDSNVLAIEKDSFYNSSLESISIPSHVLEISDSSFYHCNNLKQIKIPDNSELQKIGKLAFAYSSIESITIPSNVVELGKKWCFYTNNLKYISISPKNNNFSYIDQKMIVQKTNQNYDYLIFVRRDITSLTIPSFIKRIASDSFSFCTNLQTLDFTEDSQLISIESEAFYGSSIECITIPNLVTSIGSNAFYGCNKLKRVEFGKISKLNVLCAETFSFSSIEFIQIPFHINRISKSCFFECSSLTKVEFYENSELKIIEKNAFAQTSIKHMILPRNLKTIEEYAFSICQSLISIEFLGCDMSIESFCFSKCKSLMIVSFPNSKKLSISNDIFRMTAENFSLFIQVSAIINQTPHHCFFQLEFESQSD